MLNKKEIDVEYAKKIAVLYKDIYINEGSNAYAKRYKQDVDYEFAPMSVLQLIYELSEIYIAVAENRLSRKKAILRQNEVIMSYNPEDDRAFGFQHLSWKVNTQEVA